jgi:hypothetical protein
VIAGREHRPDGKPEEASTAGRDRRTPKRTVTSEEDTVMFRTVIAKAAAVAALALAALVPAVAAQAAPAQPATLAQADNMIWG